jgi:lysophospholipase L1-like esterase
MNEYAKMIIILLFGFIMGIMIQKYVGIGTILNKLKINNATNEENLLSPFYATRSAAFDAGYISNKSIIMIGDSLIHNAEWHEYFYNNNVLNRGMGGDTSYGLANRINDYAKHKPHKIFIMIGINDLIMNYDIKKTLRNITSTVNKIRYHSPESIIYIQSILPVSDSVNMLVSNHDIEEINHNIQRICKNNNVNYINLYPLFINNLVLNKELYQMDGLHLSGKGYSVWANAIKPYIQR